MSWRVRCVESGEGRVVIVGSFCLGFGLGGWYWMMEPIVKKARKKK